MSAIRARIPVPPHRSNSIPLLLKPLLRKLAWWYSFVVSVKSNCQVTFEDRYSRRINTVDVSPLSAFSIYTPTPRIATFNFATVNGSVYRFIHQSYVSVVYGANESLLTH